MTSNKIIQLEGLTKRYGSRTALNNITLDIEPGVSGLLGPNGCGKSTMIKSVLGLLKIQAGSARVMGYQLPHELRKIRDVVGYLPEDDSFIAGLSGIECVTYMAKLSGLPGTEALRRSHEVMDFADIGQERYRNVETYSTGMRQKLKFAQAIVHDPELLILDEPTSGLDPEQRTSMLRKINNLATQHGKSVLICTHILHDVRTVCEHIVIMSKGEIRLKDTLENLSRPSTSGVFVRVESRTPATAEDRYPDATQFLNRLLAMNVEAELREKGSVWVSNASGESTTQIWQAAAAANVFIQQLTPAKNSLEELFFNTVQEAERATA